MKKKLLILLFTGIGSLFAQAPYVIYYAVDQMKTDAYIDQPFTGSAIFELLYGDTVNNGTKQVFCYTWGCMRASVSNADKINTRVDNGYFYDYDSYKKTLTQGTIKASGRYVSTSPTRSMELSLKTYSKTSSLACTEPYPLNLTTDIPKYFDLKYTSACNQSTGVMAFNGYFKGTMAMVSESKSYPTIYPSINVDPLNISTSTVTLWAPDFMTNYFSPSEISWYQDGVELNVTGQNITVGIQGTKGSAVKVEQNCGTHNYIAVIKKFNWSSNALKISFLPNLKMNIDVLIQSPICTEAQSNNDISRYNGYVSLGKGVVNRKFKVKVNGTDKSLYSPSEKLILKVAENPFTFDFIEQFTSTLFGCPQTFTNITITPPKPISVTDTLLNDILCFGDKPHFNINIDGNTAGYTLAYGDSSLTLAKGQNQNIPLMKGSRDYAFTLSDSNGCIFEQALNFKAKEPSKLEATFSITDALCHDQNAIVRIDAKGGSPYFKESPYKYTYTPTMTERQEPIIPIKAGTKLSISLHDNHGCTVSFPDTTLYNPADFKLAVLDKQNNTCPKGNIASIQLAVTSTDKRYIYSYSKDGKTYGNEPLFTGLNSGTLTFQTKNQFGCLRDTTVQFTEPPFIAISKTAVDSVRCVGENNGSITLNISGGTGFKKLWKDQGTAYLPQNKAYTFVHSYSSLSDQSYRFYAQDSLGCLDSVSFNIGTRSNIKHRLSAINPACNESADGQIKVSNSGGVGIYQNEWILPKGLNNDLMQNGLSQGTYILRSTDKLGCSKVDTFILTAPPMLQVDLQGYPLLCKGQHLDLDAGIVAPKYEWSSLKGFKANTKVVVLTEADVYTLKVTNAFGCTGRDTFILKTSDMEFKAELWVASTVAQGDTVVMVDNNAYIDSLVWNLGQGIGLPTLADFRSQHVVFSQLGEQEIGVTGFYKGCRDVVKRKIMVVTPADMIKNDRSLGIKVSIFKECGLFPNPNDGSFSVNFTLTEPDVPVAMVLSSTTTGSLLKQLPLRIYPDGKVDFTEDLPEGSYVIHVKARDEVIALRFLVAYD